jgi:hypothetical protein
MSRKHRMLLALAGLVGTLSLAFAASTATAADSLTPASVSKTLMAGQSATIAKTLHLDAQPAKADIVLAIDTTGSMGGAIAQAQSEAISIVNDVKSSIPGARFGVVDFKDYDVPEYSCCGDYPYLLRQGLTGDASLVQGAINAMSASGGGDFPEAYNRVFYESYSDAALAYDPAAVKFLLVMGDAYPHDANLASQFPGCNFDTGPTDPGRDAAFGTADDLGSKLVLDGMKAANVKLMMLTYNGYSSSCHAALAAYEGGSQADAGSGGSLASQIVSLVNGASSHIASLNLNVSPASYSSWVSFSSGSALGAFTAPVDKSFDETITVPAGTLPGSYAFDVQAVADGAIRSTEHVNVTVPSSNHAPDCSKASGAPSLWPPNHKLVWSSVKGITDADGDPISIAVKSIKQDEPTNGLGDGDTAIDGVIGAAGAFALRAERSGSGDGRVYHVAYEASDGKGGLCSGELLASVPHDQSQKGGAVDGGALYDSTL